MDISPLPDLGVTIYVRTRRWTQAVMTLSLLTLAVASANSQTADQFTPVLVRPLTPTATPVLGTDGKYHVVYEFELMNAKPAAATLKKIEVLDARAPSVSIAAYEGGELIDPRQSRGSVYEPPKAV